MKAPEKIYIPRLEENETFVHEWSATKFRKYFSREIAENVEYIRTDAFVEKACEWIKENKDKYLYNTGEKGEYIPTCSGKIVEDFRNYMEGE